MFIQIATFIALIGLVGLILHMIPWLIGALLGVVFGAVAFVLRGLLRLLTLPFRQLAERRHITKFKQNAHFKISEDQGDSRVIFYDLIEDVDR